MKTELLDTEPMTPAHYFAVRRDGLSFLQCAEATLETPELLTQIDRLYGTNLKGKGAPIELAIDNATGRMKHDMEKFCRFVWNYIFTRVPMVETVLTDGK